MIGRRAVTGLLALLVGCATGHAPVIERSVEARPSTSTYIVREGDTLYSIAWRFDRDYESLARLNGIRAPYRIYPGQTLRLRGAAPQRSSSASTGSAGSRSSTAAAPAKWVWPANGAVRRGYGNGNKGVDIAVTPGTPVVAAAAGEVVYAGAGPRGYRHLVIVKHNARYLSAYSLNQGLRVGEGVRVGAGTRLADIEGQGTTAVVHFEVRRDGVPINPGSVIRRR